MAPLKTCVRTVTLDGLQWSLLLTVLNVPVGWREHRLHGHGLELVMQANR